jgi:hypothetical protein
MPFAEAPRNVAGLFGSEEVGTTRRLSPLTVSGDRGSHAGTMPAAGRARERPPRTSTFSAPTGFPGSAYRTANSKQIMNREQRGTLARAGPRRVLRARPRRTRGENDPRLVPALAAEEFLEPILDEEPATLA